MKLLTTPVQGGALTFGFALFAVCVCFRLRAKGAKNGFMLSILEQRHLLQSSSEPHTIGSEDALCAPS